jgi:PAS domain S-box-containing protein
MAFARNKTRIQLAVMLLAIVFFVANLFVVATLMRSPLMSTSKGPALLSLLLLTLVLSLLSLGLLLRWMLRPVRQLVVEAEKAPLASRPVSSGSEAEFVLETFQSVVAELQAQRLELERLSAHASARAASAERFNERIIASVPSGLIAFDASGIATVVNRPAAGLISSNGDDTGKSFRELLNGAPDLAQVVERCLVSGEIFRREEIHAVTFDGRQITIGATVAPIDTDGTNSSRGVLCMLTDITEVTRLREQVVLKRNLESLGEMSAGLAHEFKNALATLQGYAQLLQNMDLDAQGRSASSAMLDEVRNLTAMVSSFLNFARPQPLQLVSVSLSALIQECTEDLQTLAVDETVSLEVTGEFPIIRADDRLLRQAFMNVIRNGIEAIAPDAKRREVRVNGTIEAPANGTSKVLVEILDSGQGIPPAHLQRIFLPFFTTKAKGHGIGLALSHRVITEHGGSLRASNAKDGGALFSISLPC